MKYFLNFILSILIIIGCENVDKGDDASKNDANKNKIDTTNMPMRERIKKLIELSTEQEFKISRQQLVEEGSQYNYQVSSIQKFGKTLKYNATIPNTNIEMDYTCIPESGEYIMYMIGDSDLIDWQFKQIKVQNKWDNCREIEEGENCKSDVIMKEYPIAVRINLSITYVGKNNTVLNFRRKSTPQE